MSRERHDLILITTEYLIARQRVKRVSDDDACQSAEGLIRMVPKLEEKQSNSNLFLNSKLSNFLRDWIWTAATSLACFICKADKAFEIFPSCAMGTLWEENG